jgi:hypothetical protein
MRHAFLCGRLCVLRVSAVAFFFISPASRIPPVETDHTAIKE